MGQTTEWTDRTDEPLEVTQEYLNAFFNLFANLMLKVIEDGDPDMFNYICFNCEELIMKARERFILENDLNVNDKSKMN